MLNMIYKGADRSHVIRREGAPGAPGSGNRHVRREHLKWTTDEICMKILFLMAGCLGILAIVVAPVQAVTLQDLTIALDKTGNAEVHLTYQFSTVEYIAVYLNLANPSDILKNNLENELHKTVTVNKFSSDSMDITIPSLASTVTTNGTVSMTTPQISLEKAQTAIDQYWFAAILSPDFSPELSTVTFPDGYSARFTDQITIPSITHILE